MRIRLMSIKNAFMCTYLTPRLAQFALSKRALTTAACYDSNIHKGDQRKKFSI